MLAPQFERWSDEYTNIVFAKVDIDDAEEVAAEENIEMVPCFKFYKDGAKIAEIQGAHVEKLVKLFKEHSA